MQYQLNWPPHKSVLNYSFIPLMENRRRYLILYGGRGSGKSNFVAFKLIYRCLTEKYFRCILVRNTYASIADSSYQTLKDVIYDLGLEDLFVFKQNPLEIHCVNGNVFWARGLDDASKIKSIAGASCVWWEEDLPSEADWITVSSSVRSLQAEYLQEIFSINPETEGDFHEHWFWKRFFEDHTELSFEDTTTIEVAPEQFIELTYTVMHSTYMDNRFLPPEFAAAMMDLKRTNEYYYQVYCLGLWGNRESGSRVYKCFDQSKNVAKLEYNKMLPLWISADFNVAPGCTALISQISNNELLVIDEIQMRPPNNRTVDVCREFVRRYPEHTAGVFITGDPSGNQEDTRSEKGFNDFLIMRNELIQYRPTMRYAKAAPSVVGRINFANELFDKCKPVKVIIGDNCRLLISDLLNGPEASDGTKLKLRVRDKKTGQSWERYHHHSDCLDYQIFSVFHGQMKAHQHGPTRFPPRYGRRVSKNSY